MPANQPYDPRYNAKIYVPKLTEEQRFARATPLELLRRPKLQPVAAVTEPRSQEVTTPLPQAQETSAPREVPVPVEVPAPAEVYMPQDASAPEEVPVSHDVPASHYIPTALEVVFAEFPEIFAHPSERTLGEAHADDKYLVSARPVCNDAESDHPRQSTAYDRSHYTALLACETGTRSCPVPLHMDVGNKAEGAPHILRNQPYLAPGRGSKVELMRHTSSARRASAAFSPVQRPGKSCQLSFSP